MLKKCRISWRFFFDEHVSRLDDFCEGLRAETLNQLVCVHKQIQLELGQVSTMGGTRMLNLDSRNSANLQRASGKKHVHQAAFVEVVPATEQRKHSVANAQVQVQPWSARKATPSRNTAGPGEITEVNNVGVAPACNGVSANTTKAVIQNSASVKNVADQCGGRLLGNPSRICDGPHCLFGENRAGSILTGAPLPSLRFREPFLVPGVMGTCSASLQFRAPRGGVGLRSP